MDLKSLILVVDDDAQLRDLISHFLSSHGFRVSAAANALDMRRSIATERPDLIVLDVMMPGEDGLSAARQLTAEQGPPVIMLSALGSDTDRIIGLEIGADDYLPKPCNPRELLARVRAILRRRRDTPQSAQRAATDVIEFDGWRLDLTRRDLQDPAGVYIDLSDSEFALLRIFAEHPQRVLSRDQLLGFLRGHHTDVFDRAIDSQISRLRRKLSDRQDVELIRTVRNEGYFFVPKVVRP